MIDIKQLEAKRLKLYDSFKQEQKKGFLIFLIAGLIVAIALFTQVYYLLIGALVAGLISGNFFARAEKFAKEFKTTVKNDVVMYVLSQHFDNIYYNHKQTISLETIMSAGLIRRPDRFNGEDYVKASYKGVEFEVSDVDLKERVVRRDSRGNQIVSYETYFRGRWYVYRFKRSFKDVLKIVEGSGSYTNTRGLERFETESIQFNKKFRIFSSSKEHGFYIITSSVLEKLLELEKLHAGSIMYCFQKNELHIGVNDRKNYLEIDFRKQINEESIKVFASDVDLIAAIVNELRLDSSKFNQNR
ncbi:MAG: DUF3137 domain-containing protein [Acholeplasmataceae bacterium]